MNLIIVDANKFMTDLRAAKKVVDFSKELKDYTSEEIEDIAKRVEYNDGLVRAGEILVKCIVGGEDKIREALDGK